LHVRSGLLHSPCPLHRFGHAEWATKGRRRRNRNRNEEFAILTSIKETGDYDFEIFNQWEKEEEEEPYLK